LTKDHTLKVSSLAANKYAKEYKGTLGEPFSVQSYTGIGGVTRYRIENRTIIMASFYPSFSTISRINTNGVDSCNVTIEIKKANGHQFFEVKRLSNHEEMLESEIRFENVTCSIKEID
jgi:hypothetical protein